MVQLSKVDLTLYDEFVNQRSEVVASVSNLKLTVTHIMNNDEYFFFYVVDKRTRQKQIKFSSKIKYNHE